MNKHFPQLDGLRALAVSLVLWEHFFPEPNVHARVGQAGVRVFFTLSGFLITGILLSYRSDAEKGAGTRRQALWCFYARRALRIFPAFYAVLLVTAAINIRPVRETFLWNASYLTNVYLAIRGGTYGPITHFWTLAVEEQFYLVWPLVVLFTPTRWLLPTFVATIAIAPVFRLAAFLLQLNLWSTMILPFACLDSLGSGALLAYFADSRFGSTSQRERLSTTCGRWGVPLLIGLQAVITPLWNQPIGIFADYVLKDVALSMVATWLVASAAVGIGPPVGRLLSARPLRFIGTISYGIYLYHMFFLVVVPYGLKAMHLEATPAWIVSWIQVGLSIAVAYVSWLLLEKPLNQLKRHFVFPTHPSDNLSTVAG